MASQEVQEPLLSHVRQCLVHLAATAACIARVGLVGKDMMQA